MCNYIFLQGIKKDITAFQTLECIYFCEKHENGTLLVLLVYASYRIMKPCMLNTVTSCSL